MTSPFSFSHSPHTSRRCRGTASVEAAIALPVFVILFISVYYVRNNILAKQAAEIHARSCAWAYSMNNCESAPPGCEGLVPVANEGGEVRNEITDKLREVGGNEFAELIGDVLSTVLQPAIDAAFGMSLEATIERSFERPALYGGGTATARGTYHLACNIKDETLGEVASDAWNTLF